VKREPNIAPALDKRKRAVVISVVVLVGLWARVRTAHFMAGYIAYWGVVSGPFFLTLRVASRQH
jgi:hypothetical protein